MQLANAKMKKQPFYLHYCILILEMDTLGKDIVDNNLPMRTFSSTIVEENYIPVAKYKKAGSFYHLCSVAVV